MWIAPIITYHNKVISDKMYRAQRCAFYPTRQTLTVAWRTESALFRNFSVGAHIVRPWVGAVGAVQQVLAGQPLHSLSCRIKNARRFAPYIFMRGVLCCYGIEIGAIHIDWFNEIYVMQNIIRFRFFMWIAPLGLLLYLLLLLLCCMPYFRGFRSCGSDLGVPHP